jgi:putative oxidoreductase
MASKGLPAVEVLLALTIVLELGGGLMLLIGWKARWAALAIAGFTLLAALLFHNYWAMPEAEQMMQRLMFVKNLGIAGGLLMVFAFGPGRLSVDRG